MARPPVIGPVGPVTAVPAERAGCGAHGWKRRRQSPDPACRRPASMAVRGQRVVGVGMLLGPEGTGPA